MVNAAVMQSIETQASRRENTACLVQLEPADGGAGDGEGGYGEDYSLLPRGPRFSLTWTNITLQINMVGLISGRGQGICLYSLMTCLCASHHGTPSCLGYIALGFWTLGFKRGGEERKPQWSNKLFTTKYLLRKKSSCLVWAGTKNWRSFTLMFRERVSFPDGKLPLSRCLTEITPAQLSLHCLNVSWGRTRR